MKKKYNIAVIPTSQSKTSQTKKIIELAHILSPIADKYLLGNDSLPHVTLYQFVLDENEIPNLWQKIFIAVNEKNINLIFDKLSCITFNDDTYWASLIPSNRETLNKIQVFIASILNMPANKSYDPHLTLINTKNRNYESEVKNLVNHYLPINDAFTLSLGEGDDIGQFIKLLHSCK
jgi:hypothetical protein